MKISVIMGIYNCENTLKESIESIVNQTYKEWEMIMCDDGSEDNTLRIAKSYEDKYPEKIIVVQNSKNRGLNYTLNKCLKLAKGEYIARMDADDISSKDRFLLQKEILEKNKGIAIVSANMEYFDETGIWGVSRSERYPSKENFIYGTPFCHAPCMVRKQAYEKVGGYTEKKRFLRVEDYHLWIKMYEEGYRGVNIEQVLYSMRDDRNAYKRRKFKYRINEVYVRYLAFKKLKLDIKKSYFIFRPIVVGIIPGFVYKYLHKKKLQKVKK